MLCFYPLASCKETVRGSRIDTISTSGQLVTHWYTFASCESDKFFQEQKNFSRGKDSAGVFGYSSKAFATREIGACLGSYSKRFKQRTTASSPGSSKPSKASSCSECKSERMPE